MPQPALCATVLETLDRVRADPSSASGLVEACLARIAAREPAVAAWEIVDEANARKAALAPGKGPLAGLAIGIKDVIDTADSVTTYGSRAYAGHRPNADAACVATLRAAGAIVLGKTVSTEFASSHPGKTRNPHDPGHTPGGSSSGSAAAVADGMVPVALGTQTAGSVIRPASFCGVVGYKGTRGWTDIAGIHPLAPTFDTLGIFARQVADIAPVRAVLAEGARPRVRPRIPRVGVCRSPVWDQCGPGSRAVLEATARRIAAAGATVFEVVLPASWDALVETHKTIMLPDMPAVFADVIARRGELVSASFKAQVRDGAAMAADIVAAARRAMALRQADFAHMVRPGEIWITPAAPDEAPAGIGNTGDPAFNRLWTLLYGPCVSLPAGVGAKGLPIGVQLVSPAGTDDDLLDAAAWVEGVLAA